MLRDLQKRTARPQSEHLIRKLNCFTRLSPQDEDTLVHIGMQRVRNLGAHSNIIEENDRPKAFYVVQEGWACGYKLLQDGHRQITSFFLPGDVCHLNLFFLRRIDHSIGTITPVRVSEISQRSFEELTAHSPRTAQALWWESLVGASIQREWTVNIAQRGAFDRVAHLICELFVRLRSTGLTSGDSCEFPLTQADIGDALGLTSIHVNRMLQQMRLLKLITLKDRVLAISDFQTLQQIAGFNPNYLHLDPEVGS